MSYPTNHPIAVHRSGTFLRLHPFIASVALIAAACGNDDPTPSATDPYDAPGYFESSLPGGSSGPRGAAESAGAADDAATDGAAANPGPPAPVNDEEPGSAERAIEEADILSLDGERLYALSRYGGLSVIDVSNPKALRLLGRHKVLATPFEMYVDSGSVFVLYNGYGEYQFDEQTEQWSWYQRSYVVALDAENPATITERGRFPVGGYISDSRIIGDVLYVMAFEDGYCWECSDGPRTNLISLDVSDATAITKVDALSFEETENTYGWKKSLSSTDQRLYIAGPAWGSTEQPEGSVIQVVDVSDPAGKMELGASVEVSGQIESRWQMDEYEGVLRVISQPFTWRTDMVPVIETFAVQSSRSIAKLGSLDMVLPRPERLQSVRFDGSRGYAITFEQTDPLFTIDLADPVAPVQAGELEMPGWVYYMHPHGDRVLGLGYDQGNEEGALTVSLFDVSDLATPTLIDRVNFGGDWAYLAEDQDRIHKSFKVLNADNLILVPFSGWSYDDSSDGCYTSEYQSGVQLVDWDDAEDDLTLRGMAPARGSARRGFLHQGTLFTMSDDRVETFDVSDRDAPEALGTVSLARRVDAVAGSGDTLITVGYDWWTNVTEVTASALSDENAFLDAPELELGQLNREECNGYSYLGGMLSADDAVYFTYYDYSYDSATGKSDETTRIVTVDTTDPEAPRAVGDVALEFTPSYYGYGYVQGLVSSGEAIVNAGSTLVFANSEVTYDEQGRVASEEASAHVVDLSDPKNARTTEVSLPAGLGSTGLVIDGNVIARSHFEAGSAGPSSVRFFIDRIDVSDPAAPTLMEPVNVPGSLLVYDSDSERAVVVDYAATDKQTTSQDCYENEGGWFEYSANETRYDENSIGTCHTVLQTLRLVAIEDGMARVLSSYPLEKGESVGLRAMGDDRLFVSLGSSYYGGYYYADDVAYGYGYRTFASGSADLLVLGGLESGEFEASRLTLETGDSYYGSVTQLVAKGQRAVVSTGWQGSLSVIDASRADEPRIVRDVEVDGYVQSLRVIGDVAVAAMGYDGAMTIEFD